MGGIAGKHGVGACAARCLTVPPPSASRAWLINPLLRSTDYAVAWRNSTAPKDGTPLDLWAVDILRDGRPQEGERYPDAVWYEGVWCYYDEKTSDYCSIEDEWNTGKTVVTHWKPVPEPSSA